MAKQFSSAREAQLAWYANPNPRDQDAIEVVKAWIGLADFEEIEVVYEIAKQVGDGLAKEAGERWDELIVEAAENATSAWMAEKVYLAASEGGPTAEKALLAWTRLATKLEDIEKICNDADQFFGHGTKQIALLKWKNLALAAINAAASLTDMMEIFDFDRVPEPYSYNVTYSTLVGLTQWKNDVYVAIAHATSIKQMRLAMHTEVDEEDEDKDESDED